MIDSWDRLRVFAAVARHGSVSTAAAELHLTPPAVSHHIRGLERELGTSLVERSGRGIRLTVAGRVLAARSQEAGTTVRRAEAEIAALSDEVSGPVRVGASGTVLRSLAPLLGAFARARPGAQVEVTDLETVDLLPKLRRDELDLVVAESWSPAPRSIGSGLVSETLRIEPIRVAVSAGDSVATHATIAASTFADATWATCPDGSDPSAGLHALVAAEAHGRTPRISYRVNDFATALAFVREGLAWALVTDLSLLDSGEGVVLLATDPPVARTLSLVQRTPPQRPAVAALAGDISAAFKRGEGDDGVLDGLEQDFQTLSTGGVEKPVSGSSYS